MSKFVCSECGSINLAYHKYVKCVTPVEIQEDGAVAYLSSEIDEDESLGVDYGFCCAHCGTIIYHRGEPLQTEGELMWYLRLSEYERQRQENEYFEQIRDQQDYEEQQRREFEESICSISED